MSRRWDAAEELLLVGIEPTSKYAVIRIARALHRTAGSVRHRLKKLARERAATDRIKEVRQ